MIFSWCRTKCSYLRFRFYAFVWLWALCCFGRAIKIEYIITFCYAKQTSLKLRIRHTLTHRETHNRNHYYQRGANIDKATDGASNVILCFSRYFFSSPLFSLVSQIVLLCSLQTAYTLYFAHVWFCGRPFGFQFVLFYFRHLFCSRTHICTIHFNCLIKVHILATFTVEIQSQ